MTDLSAEEFRHRGLAVVDWVAAYRAGLPDRPVQPDVTPGSVRAAFPAALPEEPEPLDALLDALDRTVVPTSSHWQHPGWFGYFPANASLHSLLGDLFSGGLGAQGMLWSTSPAATEIEQALLDAFADALGLDPAFTFAGGGGGVIQDSASSAALVALLAALHRANPTWRDDGVDGRDRVYVTAETHSSRQVGLARCSAARRATSAAEDAESWITPPPPPANVNAGSRPSAPASASSSACSISVAAGEVDQSMPCAPSPPESRSPSRECSEALAGK